VVAAFLAALRGGDFDALVAVLAPDVVVRADRTVAPPDGSEARGAHDWARQAVVFGRMARAVGMVLVDGAPGLFLARRGRVTRVLRLAIADGRIARIEIIADPEQLDALDLALDLSVLDDGAAIG
jgi:ketosteroid isomerase-like protein